MPPYAPLCRGFFLRLPPGASMRPRPGLPQASRVESGKEQRDKNEGEQRGRIHWPRKATIPEERRRREKGPGLSLISRTGRATQGKGASERDVTSKALRKKPTIPADSLAVLEGRVVRPRARRGRRLQSKAPQEFFRKRLAQASEEMAGEDRANPWLIASTPQHL